ncbi:hypothetical protein QC762_0116290 [Podospora pseudocomata]|uniref:Transporter n=1 Tax=Podospora pseudocomata TaxID=2093779 RepID=A0ABR0G5Z4_9PEZI|nr:hypothetical protein QC762_0116290 [Podospora pseudocomata]
MNLASALTDGFAERSNLDRDTINLGNQLLFLDTVVLEIPIDIDLSNLCVHQLGPRKWISSQILFFGLVGTLQILITNRADYLASRLCLGLAESGYIPRSIYTISTWYTSRKRTRRVAVFFIGMFGGNALSPLLASGILKLSCRHGLRDWQWLFLDGLFTFLCERVVLFLVAWVTWETKPLVGRGLVVFSEKDREILQDRLVRDGDGLDLTDGKPKSHIPLAVVWKTVKHWRRWLHFVSTFCIFSTWSPLTTCTPSIIM